MKRQTLILSLVGMFIAGVLAGAVVTVRFVHPPFGPPPSSDEITRHIMADLSRDVKLTPAQVAEIQPIVERSVKDLVAFHGELETKVWASLDATDAQIAKLLEPSQRAGFEKFRANRPQPPRHQ